MEKARAQPHTPEPKEDEEIYIAHILVGSITNNTTFDSGGKPFSDDEVKDTLMQNLF